MSDQVLTILKFCLLALVYLFLARVVWVVASEMRGTPAPAAPPRAASHQQPRRKQWKLVVVTPAAMAGNEYWVQGDTTIGRGAGCSLSIPNDTFASQVHAHVFDRDGQLWLEDLGSTNGTVVNGQRLTEAVRLRKGDKFQVGETIFEAST
jgi:hypothetical protein